MWTGTPEAVDFVMTGASVHTWIVDTIVDVKLTVKSHESFLTLTGRVAYIICTDATILTWVRITLIHVVFTITALVTIPALALVCVPFVMTCAFIFTQLCYTNT